MSRCALVLTGGGARGAYQAGVLEGLGRILPSSATPFRILTGSSAGAINATFLGARASTFAGATGELSRFWSSIQFESVFETRTLPIARTAASWLRVLSLGGLAGGVAAPHLLDTSPLRRLLEDQLDPRRIREHIASGRLHALGVVATSYGAGTAVTFFDGSSGIEPWTRRNRLAIRAGLTVDHVLASTSIPVLFSPVKIGHRYFGDGGLRLTTPLSPAIRLGADRIMAISVRTERSAHEVRRSNAVEVTRVDLAQIVGEVLNAVFMDHLDADADRMEMTNELLGDHRTDASLPVRRIPLLVLRPSRDLGQMAHAHLGSFPRLIQHLLRGWGRSLEEGDLLSYLAFHRAYTESIVELGRADALRGRDEIERFLDA